MTRADKAKHVFAALNSIRLSCHGCAMSAKPGFLRISSVTDHVKAYIDYDGPDWWKYNLWRCTTCGLERKRHERERDQS